MEYNLFEKLKRMKYNISGDENNNGVASNCKRRNPKTEVAIVLLFILNNVTRLEIDFTLYY